MPSNVLETAMPDLQLLNVDDLEIGTEAIKETIVRAIKQIAQLIQKLIEKIQRVLLHLKMKQFQKRGAMIDLGYAKIIDRMMNDLKRHLQSIKTSNVRDIVVASDDDRTDEKKSEIEKYVAGANFLRELLTELSEASSTGRVVAYPHFNATYNMLQIMERQLKETKNALNLNREYTPIEISLLKANLQYQTQFVSLCIAILSKCKVIPPGGIGLRFNK